MTSKQGGGEEDTHQRGNLCSFHPVVSSPTSTLSTTHRAQCYECQKRQGSCTHEAQSFLDKQAIKSLLTRWVPELRGAEEQPWPCPGSLQGNPPDEEGCRCSEGRNNGACACAHTCIHAFTICPPQSYMVFGIRQIHNKDCWGNTRTKQLFYLYLSNFCFLPKYYSFSFSLLEMPRRVSFWGKVSKLVANQI